MKRKEKKKKQKQEQKNQQFIQTSDEVIVLKEKVSFNMTT